MKTPDNARNCTTHSSMSETHKPDETDHFCMTSEQWIAIFFTLLMIGSAIAFGAVSLI